MIEIAVYGDGKLKDDREKAEALNFYLAFISSTKENDLQTEKGKASTSKMKLNPYMGENKTVKKQSMI